MMMNRMRKIAQHLPAGWPYVVSIALTKGLSLFTIPLVVQYYTPTEYGRLDIAASYMEFISLIFAFGLAQTLLRFTATTKDSAEEKRIAAQIVGSGLILVGIFSILLQLAVPLYLHLLPIPFGEHAIRFGFFAATLAGLIQLPLAWVRFKNRPVMFLVFTGMRGIMQSSSMVWLAYHGYSIETVLIVNAAIDTFISIIVMASTIKETGVKFSREGFKHTTSYGFPIVFGSLSLFVLGAFDRWFLAGHIPPADLALYAIATKLALAAPLLMEPFGMWWYARRLAIFEQPNGPQKCAETVGMGFTVLLLGAAAVSLTGPLFIHWFLPASYADAIIYLPWIIGITVLNESSSLMNLGVYRRDTGLMPMAINTVAAVVALIGYWLTTPYYGIGGAIGSTIAAQAVRLTLFVIIGQQTAPIPYPYLRTGILAVFATFAIWIAPDVVASLYRVSWAMAAILMMASIACFLGMVKITIPRPGKAPILIGHNFGKSAYHTDGER